MKNQLKIKVSDVISFVKSKYYLNDHNKEILIRFNSIDLAKKGDIVFISSNNLNAIKILKKSNASLILCPIELKKEIKTSKSTIIFVDNPRLWFLRCLQKFFPKEKIDSIDSTSIVKTKLIGNNFSLGPFCYISKNVVIGNNVTIFGNVFIHENVVIGNNVIINASTTIGSDGFGYERNSKKRLEKFPHIGKVEIHDDVEIGSNTCIDRGTLGSTVIGSGTKIDNLVHIAHNVIIGKNCAIVANSLLGGSCVIGDNAYISMSSTIRDSIKIGNSAIVGMGSVVVKNVLANTTVYGVSAKPVKTSKSKTKLSKK